MASFTISGTEKEIREFEKALFEIQVLFSASSKGTAAFLAAQFLQQVGAGVLERGLPIGFIDIENDEVELIEHTLLSNLIKIAKNGI